MGLIGSPLRLWACSICRCGDPTFSALGKEGYAARGFRLALDWERFDKEDPAVSAEQQVENRSTALGSYSFGERFALLARVPYSVRSLTTAAAGEVRRNDPHERPVGPRDLPPGPALASGMTVVGRRGPRPP
jgi:hypothetical protein